MSKSKDLNSLNAQNIGIYIKSNNEVIFAKSFVISLNYHDKLLQIVLVYFRRLSFSQEINVLRNLYTT